MDSHQYNELAVKLADLQQTANAKTNTHLSNGNDRDADPQA